MSHSSQYSWYHVLTKGQFTNSVVSDSQNGARIKTNYNTTGFVSNVTYSNIAVNNITMALIFNRIT
jgi:polygalacturonase